MRARLHRLTVPCDSDGSTQEFEWPSKNVISVRHIEGSRGSWASSEWPYGWYELIYRSEES